MSSEVECDKVEDGKGSEISIKGFAIKASISDVVSLGEGEEKTGSKSFLGCGEEVLAKREVRN